MPEIPFLWNVYPFHPYKDTQFSNRKPGKNEILEYADLIDNLLKEFKFEIILAVGKTSLSILEYLGYAVTYIRHPSYGGSTQFSTQLKEFYLK